MANLLRFETWLRLRNDVLASEDWAARPPFGAAVNQVLNSSEILEANRAVGVHGFEVKRAILADRDLILQRTENRFLLIKLAVAALGAAGIFLVYLVGILLQVARSTPGSTSGYISEFSEVIERWGSGEYPAEVIFDRIFYLLDDLFRPREGWFAFAFTAFSVALLAALIWWYGSTTFRSYKALTAELADDVLLRTRQTLNELALSRPTNLLHAERAPGLSGHTERTFFVIPPEIDRIGELTDNLGASVIAVSGDRGIGKTSMLRYLADPEYRQSGQSSLRIMTSAPVSYDTREFLVHLYIQLCRLVIRIEDRKSFSILPTATRAQRLLAILKFAFFGLVILWVLALAEGGRRFSSAFEDLIEVLLPWATLLAALAIIVIALPTRKPGSGSSSSSVGEFLALADERLQQLRFQQTESREKATGLKPAWLELGRKFARQTADRPMSLPELVESYRDFVEQGVTWWQGRNNGSGNITIAIDEVDRIASAEQAERFINEVKSIFGTRNCVYLVAVSEETLASFERRLVQGRSVLDNSFDEVLRIDSLDLSRTANLLSSRVVGIPLIFLVLCHCLSGGVPRELIRVARVMFDVRRSTQQRHIEPVATETVQRELQSLKRGFYTRISAQAAPSAERVGKILDNLSQTGWPGRTPVEIRRKAPSLLLDGDGQPAELAVACEELAAALSFYATVLDLFATHLDIISDSGSTRDSPLADAALIEDVAQTRRSLSVSAALARRRLDRIQESISS